LELCKGVTEQLVQQLREKVREVKTTLFPSDFLVELLPRGTAIDVVIKVKDWDEAITDEIMAGINPLPFPYCLTPL
jgi:hypothetical protein